MRQSSLAIAFASVPRRRIARDTRGVVTAPMAQVATPAAVVNGATPVRHVAGSGDGHWLRLRLAVASAQVFTLRQTLHRAIGDVARVYVVEVDHRHDETILHIEVERGGRDAAMHAIMTALPAAEFGVTTVLGSDHAAH